MPSGWNESVGIIFGNGLHDGCVGFRELDSPIKPWFNKVTHGNRLFGGGRLELGVKLFVDVNRLSSVLHAVNISTNDEISKVFY